jgi:predicted dehydrogenase
VGAGGEWLGTPEFFAGGEVGNPEVDAVACATDVVAHVDLLSRALEALVVLFSEVGGL